VGNTFRKEGYFLKATTNGENTMSYLNQVLLIDNLGKNPEVVKTTELGAFVRLSLATSKKYRDAKGEWVETTHWHTVYVNNGIGKYISTYAQKGDKVYVSGELFTNSWKDKDGKDRFATAVYGNERSIFRIP